MIKRTRGKNRDALTLVEILTVVAIIGVLAALASQNITAMKRRVDKDSCVNNLRQIKLAKEEWALENNKEPTDTPLSSDLDAYIKDGCQDIICPSDPGKAFTTSYNINSVNTDPACRISSDHRL